MKTIAFNSVKGGTGKSTLSALFIKTLAQSGFRCLAIDADASNHSLSLLLYDHGQGNARNGNTVFRLFMDGTVKDCASRIDDNLDLISGDVRLNEFRSTDSLKRLKRILQDAGYDFD
jgi:chromosome partitioning protein